MLRERCYFGFISGYGLSIKYATPYESVEVMKDILLLLFPYIVRALIRFQVCRFLTIAALRGHHECCPAERLTN
jgi:hypothetical protein